MMASDNSAKIFVAAAIGFAAGLLFAPKSGRETREEIRHKADEARQKVNKSAHELRDYAREGKDQLKQAAENVRKHGRELKSDLEDQTEEIRGDTGRKTTGRLKKSM